MKKKLAALLSLLLLCGSSGEEEQVFSLTVEEQQAYTETINDVMEEFYWDYDKASLTFGGATVPENVEENARLFAASETCEYPLKNKAGQEAVLAQASLLHYNGDAAGMLQCWFVDGTLAGVAYSGGYDKAYYSLKERNPFVADGAFQAYETWTGMEAGFTEGSGEFSPEGIYSTGKDADGNPLAVSIQNGAAAVYRYNGVLSRYRNFSYGNGLEATSAVFLDGKEERLAVLVSSIEESGESDAEKTYSRAERIMLYDENLQVTGEIPLEGELCTAIGAEKDVLYLFDDQDVDIYEKKEDGWGRTGSRKLKHSVSQFHVTDLDGNGVMEYLMTDGMDLYLYHNTGGSFRKIWSTHLGVENFYGPITSGDLNGDGVKEIYACDTTATTIRYVLTEKGLQTENEDIDYGQCIYPCDFDGNGKTDYWLVQDNIDRLGQLYLAVGEE
ncbi:MAG: VCBS repeat-containing protein [Anaerotignum sp.]|nr:VCBS repeat-containing protein [Anaerotignum sp.]